MHVAELALQLTFVVYAEAHRLPQRPVAALQAQPVAPPHCAVDVRMPHWGLQTLRTASYKQPVVAVQEAEELIREHVAPHDVPDHKQAASPLQASWFVYLKRHSMLQELPVHWHIV